MPAVEKVMEIAKPEFKARMAVKLAVAGAFHTDFMAPAVSKLEEVLKEVCHHIATAEGSGDHPPHG